MATTDSFLNETSILPLKHFLSCAIPSAQYVIHKTGDS